MSVSRNLVFGLRPVPPRLRVLVVSRCFPNRLEPLACAFARQQVKSLARLADVEVWSPLPYVPGAAWFGDRTRAGRLSRVPLRDRIDGIPVVYPRAPYVPGGGRVPGFAALNLPLYMAALLPELSSLRGRFDVALGTFLYPDGVATAALARLLGIPILLKAHGTDVNVVARWPSVRPMIRAALQRARFSLGVSRPMVEALVELGSPCDRAVLLPNGVDRTIFHPRDRIAARRALGLPDTGRTVLFVGGLEREKGLAELFDAWVCLRRTETAPVHLVLVGEGSLRARLDAAARDLGNPERGRLILAGPHPLPGVADHLAACDIFTLPSWHEGTPNVVLEALAAGRPVVASRVGGIPDALPEGRAGLLVTPRDTRALTVALREALSRTWDEEAMVAAAPPSWDDSARRLHDLLADAVSGESSRALRHHLDPDIETSGAFRAPN
ncbi:Putative teichuronic acid biosynthesis glycosyl transferase TuaC [Minicystis rosea]|nr:Putative teichuronic acid biosynthesis glycosyl transferase TuaC [Minicystis rosea]